MVLYDEIGAEGIEVFLMESDEKISFIEENINRLETEGGDDDLLQELFRAAHTLKGSSAMLGHEKMAEVTLELEILIKKLRNRELKFDKSISMVILDYLEIVKALKEEVASRGGNGIGIKPVLA